MNVTGNDLLPDSTKPLPEPEVNIGSGIGLVPWGNKPLPGPMLTQIYVITRSQWVKSYLLASYIHTNKWQYNFFWYHCCS